MISGVKALKKFSSGMQVLLNLSLFNTLGTLENMV